MRNKGKGKGKGDKGKGLNIKGLIAYLAGLEGKLAAAAKADTAWVRALPVLTTGPNGLTWKETA